MAKFEDVLDEELRFINFRRARLRQSLKERHAERVTRSVYETVDGAHEEGTAFIVPRSNARRKLRSRLDQSPDEAGAEERAPVHVEEGSNLTGIALSGGGVRSAAFCLGVLQALDALTDDGAPPSGNTPETQREPSVIDALDYMSAVSGGGYIAASTVACMVQGDRTFPFASKLDAQETPEIKHLRDNSNFLVPKGFADYAVNLTIVLRGLAVNAVMVLPVLLFMAVLTALYYPDVQALENGGVAGRFLPAGLESHLGTLVLVAVLVCLPVTFIGESQRYLKRRRRILVIAAGLLGCAFLTVFWQLQSSVIKAMFAAPLPPESQPASHSLSIPIGQWLAQHIPGLAGILVPLLAVFIAAAQKLAQVAKATFGEATWTGLLQKNVSRLLLYVAASIVPLLLWLGYLILCHWAIRNRGQSYEAPGWLLELGTRLATWWPTGAGFFGHIAALYVVIAAVLSLVALLFSLNVNSLHGLYRDRLAEAFLISRHPAGSDASEDPNNWKLSALMGSRQAGEGGDDRAASAPYLLLNTAINLTSSRELNRRGRNADTFIFSPLFVGSRATDYVRTPDMEKIAPRLGLATAMAISGAAGSANMGRNTIPYLTPSLALLNIRLGYWLPNPKRLSEWPQPYLRRFMATRGASHFLAEISSILREDSMNVHLTDGGHIENLGIYELLQRRCKVIVAIDAEADPEMVFNSFVALQLLARIDLGVRIELPWQDLQKRTLAGGISSRGDSLAESCGPHVALGIIHYNDEKKAQAERGILIYIKSSLSGDENDLVRDYKRRNRTFPHETTVDQFFSEEQFEVYRALGFHAARGFFTGRDRFASPEDPPSGWGSELYKALALLNVPDRYRMDIVSKLRRNTGHHP